VAEENDKIKIEHYRSPHFTSTSATGALISGPTPDGLYHLIFYSDAMRIEYETGVPREDGVYKISLEKSGIRALREDKALISMTPETLRRLSLALVTKFAPKKEADDSDKA
jgi:hypothetical protein